MHCVDVVLKARADASAETGAVDARATLTSATLHAVAMAELGLSLFRKVCRKGNDEDMSGHQPVIALSLMQVGVVQLTIDILSLLGPGNAPLVVQCVGLLHFLVYSNVEARQLVGAAGCELIVANLTEHGPSNSFITNHGL